jgi:GNAT superfamily N-acetyltransferase
VFTLQDSADPNILPGARPAFIQSKVDAGSGRRVEALIRAGYALVETAVTLEREAPPPSSPPTGARFALPSDALQVGRIAGEAFRFSRFHVDPMIPASVGNRIKRDWAVNFFSGGRGTHMVVASEGDRIVGFLLIIARDAELIIDLVGVAPAAQGRGHGRAMVDFATCIEGPRRWVVGTQLSNMPSLAYYAACGFRPARAVHVLHRHVH